MSGINVLLPLGLPDTKSLRRAAANILRDVQREHEHTDQQTADALGVSIGTIRNIRNEQSDISSLTLARVGAVYGKEAVRPYLALLDREPTDDTPAPLPALGDAVAALSRARGLKGELDALPAIKEAVEALNAFVSRTERKRLRVVS